MKRRLNPLLMNRLHIEADGIETAVHGFIANETARIGERIAVWQPGPMPEDWFPSDLTIVELEPPLHLTTIDPLFHPQGERNERASDRGNQGNQRDATAHVDAYASSRIR